MVPSAFGVYIVVPHPEKGEEWLRLGSAVPHLDGKGFNLLLQPQSLPLDAKVVLRDLADATPPEQQAQSLAEQVEAFERATIERCLASCGGRVSAVMERLNIPRRTLSEKMARLGIDRRRFVARHGGPVPRTSDANGENTPVG
jgi:DNA-binding NtrC family response regulator